MATKVLVLTAACFPILSTYAIASPASTAKSGIIENGCHTLGQVTLCSTSDQTDDILLRVAGIPTRILTRAPEGAAPYEIELLDGRYRVKVGAPSRSDVPFFAYTEVQFRKVGQNYRVDRYTIATDSKCEGSPDIRMIYEFDLGKRTMTAILAPPWSNDGKIHRFVHPADLKATDLFHLSDWDFINLLGDRSEAAIQRLCSA